MKNTLLFLMLLLGGMAGAQIVNIPDAAFKTMLLSANSTNYIARDSSDNSIVIDTNNDGEIQVSEALVVWHLFISDPGDMIVSIQGIKSFTNLRKISIYVCQGITSFNYTGLTHLQELYITHAPALGLVNISNFPNLKKAIIDDSEDITSLNFTGLADIEELVVRNCTGLSSLTIPNNLQNLKKIEIMNTYLSSLDCTGMTTLESLMVRICPDFSTLTFGDNPNLKNVNIDFEGTSLDFSALTGLETLRLEMGQGETPIRFINLKNGVTEYDTLMLILNSSPTRRIYLCMDEGNEILLPAWFLSSPNIFVNAYCSFFPGGDYNTITGGITFDGDGNGCDDFDTYADSVRMNIDNSTESISTFTTSGNYNFYTQFGSFMLTPQFENDWFTATPPSVTINLATVDNSTTIQNFCVTANGVHPDVEVVITPLRNARPGFDVKYKIVYKNKGNQVLSGIVTLNYDDSKLDSVLSYPVESTTGEGALTWNYTSLQPFESRSIHVTFNLNGPMETPPVVIGDHLNFNAVITPLENDETEPDNFFNIKQEVVGSYDPNDITCLEGRSVSPDKIGEYLHYNINFENTGTAPATFIVVKDMIDETKFDINTLQLMDASHTIETRINGNKVEFIFDNINLGPEEKGNVTFKIKTLNTLQVNDDVTQQADIFFDYNWPIQTNEATTTFEVLSRGDFAMDNSVKVYPNPVKSIVTISADSTLKSIQLYDIQGRLLQSGTVNDIDTTIDLSSRTAGIYFVKVVTDKGMKIEKVVKK